MHQNNRQHFLLSNLVKNEAESQAVFAVSYVRNVRGRAMLPDSTVNDDLVLTATYFMARSTSVYMGKLVNKVI